MELAWPARSAISPSIRQRVRRRLSARPFISSGEILRWKNQVHAGVISVISGVCVLSYPACGMHTTLVTEFPCSMSTADETLSTGHYPQSGRHNSNPRLRQLDERFVYAVPRADLFSSLSGLDVSVLTKAAHRRHNVDYPDLYANSDNCPDEKSRKAFNCVQRGHQNSLESQPAVLALLITSGLQVRLSHATAAPMPQSDAGVGSV